MTAGANQALVSLMLTLLDPSDRAVLFRPYYFNTLMAIQVQYWSISPNHVHFSSSLAATSDWLPGTWPWARPWLRSVLAEKRV